MPENEFSNPLAPDGMEDISSSHNTARLTNEDFRKLLMTPRANPTAAPPSKPRGHEMPRDYNEDEDPAARRRKKKSYYARLKAQELERAAELAERYRDRARERREGSNRDYADQPATTTHNYRAVGPSAEADKSAAEKRQQLIKESKFLGGDMEHTHLVKGLDYALLQKVRAEISSKEKEEEDVLEQSHNENKPDEDPESKMEFRTKMARNIYRVLFKARPMERNELFLPGRMAYVVDLEDEYADSDVPTTLIRSKADCPSLESHATLTTNDIVINKLTQILSYLRQGTRGKKIKRKDKNKIDDKKPPEADLGIFDEVGDYIPIASKAVSREIEQRPHGGGYFEKPQMEEPTPPVDTGPSSAKELIKSINDKFATWGEGEKPQNLEGTKAKGGDFLSSTNSYLECYPGSMMEDPGADSDEEVDYSKMDQGNKKGPLGRWDFDSQEEYSRYMSNKEALPKAAFQYGIKMSEGRKTRRNKETNEKAELDREWKKISAIIEKRKALAADGIEMKRPKY